MEGCRLRYKKCWEFCHEALQKVLSQRQIESDPGDARVLATMLDSKDLDIEEIIEAARAHIPRGDGTDIGHLRSQMNRLVLVAAKVKGFTWEEIKADATQIIQEKQEINMGDLPRKLIC